MLYIERMLRLIAGSFILVSLLLAHYHHQNWLWLAGFVGLNLFQSFFTNWCPMISLLEKLGIPRLPPGCKSNRNTQN